MFDKEFYPTPKEVYDSMGVDCIGKIVLEPSAGSGNIVDFLIDNGAKEVLSIEKNKDLQKIVSSKSRLIGDDFLKCTTEDISHIDMIVMNPPFSNADAHILHAWEISPEGCEIIALCNWQTIENDYSVGRRNLTSIVSNNGDKVNLGDCFSDADRKTGIDIGLVKIFKPVVSDEFEFEGFYMEEEQDIDGEGIMQFDEVRSLVNRYVSSVKCFDKLSIVMNELQNSSKGILDNEFSLTVGYDNKVSNKEDFCKHMQKESWKYIFNKMNLSKYVTSGVMKDINKFVETQQKYPFTMKNIYKMFEIIVGTRDQTFNRALEEAIDNFTKYTNENRFGVEGWKTNSGHMLNKKFIVDWMVEVGWHGDKMDLKYSQHADKITDLNKVLCGLTATNYDDIKDLRFFFNDNKIQPSTWYDWGFFKFKCFKKGTMHLKFKDNKDWYALNQAYGKLKGFTLNDKYKQTNETR
jgi:predicted rRNA methylase YqxC with S4 and FtsJ domains|tara:strand:- start:1530 stop:2918 length:1389 start_codon:yes stop_codon:yes gene_type:complete